MNLTRACLLSLALGVGGAAYGAATVIRVEGDLVELGGAGSARVGDTVEILTRLPGFDELAKVGSGHVVSVGGGRLTARIDQRSGALAVGQEARLSTRPAQAPGPPAVGPSATTAPVRYGGPSTTLPPALPAEASGSLERDLNEALRQNQLERVKATVSSDREITLRGSVTSPADKQRAMDIARRQAQARPVKDQVFVVEP